MISDVLRLDTLKEAGATFAYPDALSPTQWIGLEALTVARRRYQAKKDEPQQKEQAKQATMDHLARLSRGY